MMLYPTAARRYADESGRLRTPASVRSFMKVMRTLQNRHPDHELDDFTPEELADWCMMGKDPAPSTVKKRRAHARSFFGWALWKGLCSSDPTSQLAYSVNPGRGVRRLGNWLDAEQAVEVIRACPTSDVGQRDRVILLLGFLLGLRASDMVDLRWDQFNADYTRLTVVGKGQKPAVLGVPAEAAEALQEWRRRRPMGGEWVLPRTRQVTVHGKRQQVTDWDTPLQYDGILYAVQRAGRRCDLKLNPHDLRRSFGQILEDAGKPITDISRAMRHSNVGTTSVYLDRNPNKAAAVTEGFTLGL